MIGESNNTKPESSPVDADQRQISSREEDQVAKATPEPTAATVDGPGVPVVTVEEIGDVVGRPEVGLSVATLPGVRNTAVAIPETKDTVAVPETRCGAAEIPEDRKDVSQTSFSPAVPEDIVGDRKLGDIFRIANYNVYNTFKNCNVCSHNDISRGNGPRENIDNCFPRESNEGCFPRENIQQENHRERLYGDVSFAGVADDTGDVPDVTATQATPAGVAIDKVASRSTASQTVDDKKPAKMRDAGDNADDYADVQKKKAKEHGRKRGVAAKDVARKQKQKAKPELEMVAASTACDLKTKSVPRRSNRLPRATKGDTQKKGGEKTSKASRPSRKDMPERRGARHRSKSPERRAVAENFRELNMTDFPTSKDEIKRNKAVDSERSGKKSRIPIFVTKSNPKKVIAEMMKTRKPMTNTKSAAPRNPEVQRERKCGVPAKPLTPKPVHRPANSTHREPVPRKQVRILAPTNPQRRATVTQAQLKVTQSLRDAIWGRKPIILKRPDDNRANLTKQGGTRPKTPSKTQCTSSANEVVKTGRKTPNVATSIPEKHKEATTGAKIMNSETCNQKKNNQPAVQPHEQIPRELSPLTNSRRLTENQHYKRVIVNMKAAQDINDMVAIAKVELDLMMFEMVEEACELNTDDARLDKKLHVLVREFNKEMAHHMSLKVMQYPDKFYLGPSSSLRKVFTVSPPLQSLKQGAIPALNVNYKQEIKETKVHIPHPPETNKDKTTYTRKFAINENKGSIFNKVKSFVTEKLGLGSNTSTKTKQNPENTSVNTVAEEISAHIPALEKFEIMSTPPSTPKTKRKVKFAKKETNDDCKCDKKATADTWVINVDNSATPQKQAPVLNKNPNKNPKRISTAKNHTTQQNEKPTPTASVKKAKNVTTHKKVDNEKTTRDIEYGTYSVPDTYNVPPTARGIGGTPLPPIRSSRAGSKASIINDEKSCPQIVVNVPRTPASTVTQLTARPNDVKKSGSKSCIKDRAKSPPKTDFPDKKSPVSRTPTARHITYSQYSTVDLDDRMVPIPKAAAREIARTPLPPIRSCRSGSLTTRLPARTVPTRNLPRIPSPSGTKTDAKPIKNVPDYNSVAFLDDLDALLAEMGVPVTPEPLPPIGQSQYSPKMATHVREDSSRADVDKNRSINVKSKDRARRKLDVEASAAGIPITPVMIRRSKA